MPPVDVAGGWVPDSTVTVVQPGAWVPDGHIHAGTGHTEYYSYTEDGYLQTVSISDGGYDTATQTITDPSFATATLRGLDVRDAMGRVTAHYEFTPGTGPSATTLVPGHMDVSGHFQTVAAQVIPGQHIEGHYAFGCYVPPVDLPDQVIAAHDEWVDTSVWVPDAYINCGPANGPASPGAYAVFSRTMSYDNNSNELSESTATLNADGSIAVTNTTFQYGAPDASGNGTGAYWGGVVTHSSTRFATIAKGPSLYQAMDQWQNHNSTLTINTSDTKTTYVWWDRAEESLITYNPNTSQSTTNTTSFTYNGDGHLKRAQINDGRPRTITYVDNALGQIISRVDSTGPKEFYYNFAGMQRGDIGNNGRGPSDTDYATAIAARQAAAQTGPFRNGSAQSFADFDQNYVPINPASDGQTGSSYTVRDGDTLQSIANALWGDASLWYLIADANGLTGTTALAGGMTITLPNKVLNFHNDDNTFRVYDPNKAIGDVDPNVPQPTPQPPPPKKKKHGGLFGIFVAIFDAVFQFIVTAVLLPLGPVVAATLGDAITQGMKILTGQQKSFNWVELGTTLVTAGITKGLNESGVFKGITNVPLNKAVTAVTANTLTQGVKMAVGLQSKFDWASVAAAGISSYVQTSVSGWSGLAQPAGNTRADMVAFQQSSGGMINGVVSGMAGDIAGAATRSLINGSDFGDNIIAGLPDVIATTFGNAMTAGFSQGDGGSRAAAIAHNLGLLGRGIEHAAGAVEDAFGNVVSGIAGAFSSKNSSAPATSQSSDCSASI